MTVGRFITFEGIEGSGKTTQMSLLAERLRSGDREVVVTREPGGTALGAALRGLLLAESGPSIAPETELLLYAADRAQHVVEVLRPALDRGAVVLCDRYLDATLAYQGFARGLGFERVLAYHRDPPLDLRPDRTLLLDLEPDEALGRARDRNANVAGDEGRFEAEQADFHRRVRQGYLELAHRHEDRYRIVPAAGASEVVAGRVAAALDDWFEELAR